MSGDRRMLVAEHVGDVAFVLTEWAANELKSAWKVQALGPLLE